jgi:hypothetical protein
MSISKFNTKAKILIIDDDSDINIYLKYIQKVMAIMSMHIQTL